MGYIIKTRIIFCSVLQCTGIIKNIVRLHCVWNKKKYSWGLTLYLRGAGILIIPQLPIKGTPSIPETYLSSSVAWGLNLRVG